MTTEQLFPFVVSLGALLLAYLGWRRNDKGDSAELARWMGKIDEKLNSMDGKLNKVDGVPERVCDLERRVAALERKAE